MILRQHLHHFPEKPNCTLPRLHSCEIQRGLVGPLEGDVLNRFVEQEMDRHRVHALGGEFQHLHQTAQCAGQTPAFRNELQ